MLGWLAASLISAALGADAECPDPSAWLDGPAHLRALSLDLRGVVPLPGEAALHDGEVPERLVDDWLATPAFAKRAVEFHRSLLWNNVSNVDAITNLTIIGARGGIWRVRERSTVYRGRFDTMCGDFPAEFDDDGAPVLVPQPDGTVEEGWVEVAPYWRPEQTLRVCALDANEDRTSASGTDCSTPAGFTDPGCGCGPNLQWCTSVAEQEAVMVSFGAAVDHRVEVTILEDRPWTDLLLDPAGFVDGRIVHFLQHHAAVTDGVRFTEPAIATHRLPELPYGTDDWVELDRGPQHAGVLTEPGFLLRFQTGRARAAQFYTQFLCQPFESPSALDEVDELHPTPDLTARAGCRYCHALLEPAAAHWGRWAPAGAGYLSADEFPSFDASCVRCGTDGSCSDACQRLYVTEAPHPDLEPYLGWLSAYTFLEPRHESSVTQGPRALVEQGLADGRIARCAAQRAAEWMLGRPTSRADDPWLDELGADFEGSNYAWRALVKRIVLSDRYRSVR